MCFRNSPLRITAHAMLLILCCSCCSAHAVLLTLCCLHLLHDSHPFNASLRVHVIAKPVHATGSHHHPCCAAYICNMLSVLEDIEGAVDELGGLQVGEGTPSGGRCFGTGSQVSLQVVV